MSAVAIDRTRNRIVLWKPPPVPREQIHHREAEMAKRRSRRVTLYEARMSALRAEHGDRFDLARIDVTIFEETR